MIAPALERTPRMLLVIGEDEQGLPTETIILESRLYDSLRAWLEVVLPNWLGRALGLTRPSHAGPLSASEPVLIDVQLRWAGL